MTKLFEYSTPNKRSLIFDKPRLYEVGKNYYKDAKAYLVAHNQEKADDAAEAWRYRFPSFTKE
jgi:NADH-quinone oxidoreductase subunit I